VGLQALSRRAPQISNTYLPKATMEMLLLQLLVPPLPVVLMLLQTRVARLLLRTLGPMVIRTVQTAGQDIDEIHLRETIVMIMGTALAIIHAKRPQSMIVGPLIVDAIIMGTRTAKAAPRLITTTVAAKLTAPEDTIAIVIDQSTKIRRIRMGGMMMRNTLQTMLQLVGTLATTQAIITMAMAMEAKTKPTMHIAHRAMTNNTISSSNNKLHNQCTRLIALEPGWGAGQRKLTQTHKAYSTGTRLAVGPNGSGLNSLLLLLQLMNSDRYPALSGLRFLMKLLDGFIFGMKSLMQ